LTNVYPNNNNNNAKNNKLKSKPLELYELAGKKSSNKTEKSFSKLAASQFCFSRSNKSTTLQFCFLQGYVIVAFQGCVIVALQDCVIVALRCCVIVALQGCVIVALQGCVIAAKNMFLPETYFSNFLDM
jgi:hypothetical protein